MPNGSAIQRYQDSLSGSYGAGSGYFGHGPVQSYTRPLNPARLLQLQKLHSTPSQGKAMIDPYGRVLGYEREGTLIERRAQDRLFAQVSGATAQQLLGSGLPGARPNLAYLRPEQLEQLLRVRERFGATGQGNANMAASIGAAGMGLPTSAADGSGVGIPRGLDPKLITLAALAALALIFLLRGR